MLEDIRYANDDDMDPILQEKLKGDKIHFTISLDLNGASKINETDQSNRTLALFLDIYEIDQCRKIFCIYLSH